MKPSPFTLVTISSSCCINTYSPVSMQDFKKLLRAYDLRPNRILVAEGYYADGWTRGHKLVLDLDKIPIGFKKKPKEVVNGSRIATASGGSSKETREREGVVGWRGYREDGNGSRLLLD